jgi:hypothetical protein
MGSGRDLYNACCRFEGQPYSIAPGRTDPNSGHKDCSGLVAAGFEVCQGYELGAYVSTTIFRQSVDAGLEIPYWAAVNIVGALIFKPEDPYRGWGADGHIAVSDGYGGTIEATPPRVQRLPLSYNAPWSSRAALAIDLDYSNYGEGSPPQEDDGVKGLWIRRENEPFIWLLYGGYKIASGGKGQVDVMAFSGMTSNGWDSVSSLSAKDFDEIPILEWTQTPKGRYITGPPE